MGARLSWKGLLQKIAVGSHSVGGVRRWRPSRRSGGRCAVNWRVAASPRAYGRGGVSPVEVLTGRGPHETAEGVGEVTLVGEPGVCRRLGWRPAGT